MIAALNPHIVSRLARHHRGHDAPLRLTAEEKVVFDANVEHCADALLRFENVDRYVAQSAATKAGALAPLPLRPALQLISAGSPGDHGTPCLPASGGPASISEDAP